MAHPGVKEATVVAVPDEKWLERPLACVVPSRSGVTEQQLRDHLAGSFTRWMIPDQILLVQDVPKTSVGKYDKKRVREMLNTGGRDEVLKKLGAPKPTGG